MNCMIYNATANPSESWVTMGEDRGEAERLHKQAIADGRFPKPLYRVIAIRKPILSLIRRGYAA